jgi:TPR repeat protein
MQTKCFEVRSYVVSMSILRRCGGVALLMACLLGVSSGCRGAKVTHGTGACEDQKACKRLLSACEKDVNPEKSVKLTQANEACMGAARAALTHRDASGAERAFGRACERGLVEACDGLGQVADKLHRGEGITRDQPAALRLYQRACDRGSGGGCFGVGMMHESAGGPGRPRELAVRAYAKACDKGHGEACGRVGSAHASGEGAPKSDTRAVHFFRLGCDGGSTSACLGLGTHTEEGRGATKDDFRAAAAYDRACDGGDEAGCRKVAELITRVPAAAVYLEGARSRAAERRAREAEQRALEAAAAARAAEARAQQAQSEKSSPSGAAIALGVLGAAANVAANAAPAAAPAARSGSSVQVRKEHESSTAKVCYNGNCQTSQATRNQSSVTVRR